MSEDSSQSRRRKEYFQEHWEELNLSNVEASIQTELHYHQHPKSTELKESKKKKSRGNRKIQRFRAKLKKQGLDNETIATIINEYNNPVRCDDEHGKEKEIVGPNLHMEDVVESRDQVL